MTKPPELIPTDIPDTPENHVVIDRVIKEGVSKLDSLQSRMEWYDAAASPQP